MNWLRLESPAYWITFTASFLLVALWESKRPGHAWIVPAEQRWKMHGLLLLCILLLNTLVLRISPVAAAVVAQNEPWGVLAWPAIPFPVRFVAGFLLMDFIKYATHWLGHHVGFLWRVHRVHHSDPDFDVSTGARFHPLESLGVAAVDIGAIFLLAPPPAAVLCAKLVSVAFNSWEHANTNLPAAWDQALRRWVVTPTMHRLHHSEGIMEQNRNFAEILTWWDRLFGTYQPGSATKQVGVRGYQDARSLELVEMLTQPFQEERRG